jgi:hypothetical protein
MAMTTSFMQPPRVLEGAESNPFQTDPAQRSREALSYSFFCAHSLLVHLQSDPGVGVPQQLLSCLEVNALLPKHDGEPVAEGMPIRLVMPSSASAGRLYRFKSMLIVPDWPACKESEVGVTV